MSPASRPPSQPTKRSAPAPQQAAAAQSVVFDARRWTDVRVPSIAAITVVLSEVATASPTLIRVGGPITSLILASIVDTPTGHLAASGVAAWVETDRRDDRSDGWTTDRVGLEGRWVIVNAPQGVLVSGSSVDGLPDTNHAAWVQAATERPPGIDVQAWQRIDRTSWVLHDGDGEVFAELAIDEQRRMGTHEATVEARLISPVGHRVFEALIGPLHVALGAPVQPAAVASRRVADVQDSQWLRHQEDAQEKPKRADDISEASLGASPSPVVTTSDLSIDASEPTHDDLSWVIRAAIDVDTYARQSRQPSKQGLRFLSGLIGVAPAMWALYPDAASSLSPMLPELIGAESMLVRLADESWALSQIASATNEGSLQWDQVVAPYTDGTDALRGQAIALRSVVLAMLDQTEPTASTAFAIQSNSLGEAIAAWLTAHRSARKPLDTKRTRQLRATIDAYRFSADAVHRTEVAVANDLLDSVAQLDRDLRWVRRRVALLDLIDRGASSSEPLLLPPAHWMRLGVLADTTRLVIPERLDRARRRAKRLHRRFAG